MSTRAPTLSGAHIDLLEPDWRDIDLSDVAWALSGILRFNAMTRRPLSVAEHSIHVGRAVSPRLELAGLIHDAHEAIMGDITRPAASAIAARSGKAVSNGVAFVKRGLDLAIARVVIFDFATAQQIVGRAETLAVALVEEMHGIEVRTADDAMCRVEMAALFGAPSTASGAPLIAALLSDPPSRESVAEEWLAKVEEAARKKYTPALLGAE